jgi:hypothetical protein
MSWKNELIEKYKDELGCKNSGICWCETCVNIERLIDEVVEHIKFKVGE